MGCFNRTFTAQ
uniref:BLTX705 n=1 Tax=Nephila pilipes TaxID=299642 RepID=A0A076L337_NEPPI|nr:BLTX705 [Nephila pilipes]